MEGRHIRPQVLILGNGILRAYSEMAYTWHELVRRIGTRTDVPDDLSMPLPLEIVLRTGNNVDQVLAQHSRELYGSVTDRRFEEVLRSLLGIGFDHILTTNYSYELEDAAAGVPGLRDRELERLVRHTPEVDRAESRYFLHTYNQVVWENTVNRIWHIHGEARKPYSIVIGHYFYGNLLSRCHELLSRRSLRYGGDPDAEETLSWVDAFLKGDLYILGFGFDYSELDLWWLLARKRAERGSRRGEVFYYRPDKPGDAFDVKSALLQSYGAQMVNCGMREFADSDASSYAQEKQLLLRAGERNTQIYREFYPRAIEDIRQRVSEREKD